MKRSEMVLFIAEYLITNSNIFGGDQDEREECREQTFMRRQQIAHYCLKAAEEVGMVPPFHPTKGYEAQEITPTGNIDCYRKRFREWEAETLDKTVANAALDELAEETQKLGVDFE